MFSVCSRIINYLKVFTQLQCIKGSQVYSFRTNPFEIDKDCLGEWHKFDLALSSKQTAHPQPPTTMHNTNPLSSNANQYIRILLASGLSLKAQASLKKLAAILEREGENAREGGEEGKGDVELYLGQGLPGFVQVQSAGNTYRIAHDLGDNPSPAKQSPRKLEQTNLNACEGALSTLDHLLSTLKQYIFLNKENPCSSPTHMIHQSKQQSLQEAEQLLQKLIEDLKLDPQLRNACAQPNQNSPCSHSQPNQPDNSSSVRSLLTEKLRQCASSELDDPQYKNDRVLQGNLMVQLRGSKPFLMSKRFQDLSQPFSLQGKPHSGEGRVSQRGRVQSQRTILGEISLASGQGVQRRPRKTEGGCSRCQIF